MLFGKNSVVYPPDNNISVSGFVDDSSFFYLSVERIPTDYLNFKVFLQLPTELGQQLAGCFHIGIKTPVQEQKAFRR
jgi:hypothetical protein